MIRVIALCIFRHRDRILVAEGYDSVARAAFARPIGGAVEHGETSAHAIAREVAEELDHPIENLRLLGVLESLFTYEGQPRHEIAFVYDAAFVDHSLYASTELPLCEPGWSTGARWKRPDEFGEHCRLVPEGLLQLLRPKNPPSPS
jgi:8-oxo-dGTP pyrophosphatase MutT (NUDIX family)